MDINEIISAQTAGDNVAQKSFSCSFCRKCFERRSDYKRHERIHGGVRPHNCEHPDCGKKFNRRSALIVHMRVHTGEKPHMCERCGKPFGDPSALGRHRQIHSGEKLHKCPYENCQKTFTRRSTMTRHKNHHTETIQEAATATAAALATRAGSSRGGRQRSDKEQYSNSRSPMSTLSPSQRHLTTSPYSKLDHLNSYPGEYQYINNNHLSGYVQGGYHMQGQQPTTTASYSNGMRPTSHATVYGPPSILEPPTNLDRRLGSTVSSLYMNSAGYQSLSQSNANMYPDPEYYQQHNKTAEHRARRLCRQAGIQSGDVDYSTVKSSTSQFPIRHLRHDHLRLETAYTSDFTNPEQVSEMLEIKRISTPLSEYIFKVTCTALEELWAVEIQPDIFVDSSITLSHAARKLLCDIAAQLSYQDCLLLCYIKWEFNANPDIDRSWAFYFGQRDQDFSNPVQRYNAQTGDQITTEFASSCFTRIKEVSEARLYEKYRYSMDVARTFVQLGTLLQSDAGYIEYLYNQVYNFCFACLKDPNCDLDSPLVRHWYEKKVGWSDMHHSIIELEEITAKSKHLITPASFQRAFGLATVAYCGLVIQERLPASHRENQKLQSLLDCLQILSERKALRAASGEDIPMYLKVYIQTLQRQLPCEKLPKGVEWEPSTEGKLLGETPDVRSGHDNYLLSLGLMSHQYQGRIAEEEMEKRRVSNYR